MNKLPFAKPLLIAAAIAFAMLLTRGSHVLTHVSLPDASLALFLLGGLLLKRWAWFVVFLVWQHLSILALLRLTHCKDFA